MLGDFLVVDAIVEIPRGSRNKYEFDPETQVDSAGPGSVFVGALSW